jgi:hypothetical protein
MKLLKELVVVGIILFLIASFTGLGKEMVAKAKSYLPSDGTVQMVSNKAKQVFGALLNQIPDGKDVYSKIPMKGDKP